MDPVLSRSDYPARDAVPRGSHKPGRGQPLTWPLRNGAQWVAHWEGTSKVTGQVSLAHLECSRACTRPPPAHRYSGKGQGDNDRHTCVITSVIGLRYQTFTGPSISFIFCHSCLPLPLQHTVSWFLFDRCPPYQLSS